MEQAGEGENDEEKLCTKRSLCMPISEHARELHERAIVIDAHNDTLVLRLASGDHRRALRLLGGILAVPDPERRLNLLRSQARDHGGGCAAQLLP